MKKLLFPFFIIIFFYSNTVFAAYYCAKNAAYINIGDSAKQVETACGKADFVTTRDNQATQKVAVTELIYTKIFAQEKPSKITFIFHDNKLKEIKTLNNASTNNFCLNGPVEIGDNINYILKNCGAPNNKKYSQKEIETSSTKQTIWTYRFNQYHPAMVLFFTDEKLVSIKGSQ